MTTIFVLHHVHEAANGDEDIKLIGIYSSELLARAAIERLALQPGFRDHPDGFNIAEHEIDKDQWGEGFISWADATDGE